MNGFFIDTEDACLLEEFAGRASDVARIRCVLRMGRDVLIILFEASTEKCVKTAEERQFGSSLGP